MTRDVPLPRPDAFRARTDLRSREVFNARRLSTSRRDLFHGRRADQTAHATTRKNREIVDGAPIAQGTSVMGMKARELGIGTPCTLDWTKMAPSHGGRFCGDCKKVVRDLSAMTEADARALVAKERYGDLCVRMLVDRDGNVFFGGDKLISSSLLSKAKRTAAAAAAIALPLATNACTDSAEEETKMEHSTLMGGVSASDDPPAVVVVDGGDADTKGDAAVMDASADARPDVVIP